MRGQVTQEKFKVQSFRPDTRFERASFWTGHTNL
jgi:hypothetical protein